VWKWSADELAAVVDGRWEVKPPAEWAVHAVAFTRRRLEKQALVIPRCRSFQYGVEVDVIDDFVEKEYALLLQEDAPRGLAHVPHLRVASVRSALARLAVSSRANFPGRVVAVTGSAGKTSSVDMLGDMLGVFGVPKRRTVNFNTFDGVNCEVANLGREAVAVIEVAASFLSRRDALENLRPDVAMITNIGEAHMESFGSPLGIAEVKSNLFDLMRGGIAIIPRDSELYPYLKSRVRGARAREVSFGVHPMADVRLVSHSTTSGLVEADVFGKKASYALGATGRHMALNSVGALAVIAALGLDWRRAAGALAHSRELAGRGATFSVQLGKRNVTVIDGAYNANPTSMRASLETLAERPAGSMGRRIAVLGEMLELGPDSEAFHASLADSILGRRIDRVYLVGPLMRALWDALPDRVRGRFFPSIAGLWATLEPELADGDVVLFKGSHATDLQKVVAETRRAGKAPAAPGDRHRAQATDPLAKTSTLVVEPRPLPRADANGGPDTVSFVFVGDTSLGDAYLLPPGRSAELRRLNEDPWSFVERLAPLVGNKSVLVANLETVLADRPDDPFDGRKGYQGWDRPDRTLAILKRLGVDAVCLANNHTLDFGPSSLMSTIDRLTAAGIGVFGAGADAARAAQPLSYAAPFGNVHILAGFEFRAGYDRKYRFYASAERPGVNPLSRGAGLPVADAIAQLRASDPGSLIIVYPHWSGSINYGWINQEMNALNDDFLARGADLVIGHGAHRLQEMQATAKGTTVFSLGNFVFNSPGRYRKYGAPPFSLVARLDVARRAGGCAARLRLYPIVSDNRETAFRPRPVDEAEAIAVAAALREREPSPGDFDKGFSLAHDDYGWFLAPRRALSARVPRLAGGGRSRPQHRERAAASEEPVSPR